MTLLLGRLSAAHMVRVRSVAPLASKMKRPQKITLGELHACRVRGILIYCADYNCSNWIRVNTDQWSADVRLSDLENQFTCVVCGKKGAEVRPEFDWNTRLRSKTMREALTRAIGGPRFVEAPPSGTRGNNPTARPSGDFFYRKD
jgi:hypothetical protein